MGKPVKCPLCGGETYLWQKRGVLPQLYCDVHGEIALLLGRKPVIRIKLEKDDEQQMRTRT
jgi:hypothetical protein